MIRVVIDTNVVVSANLSDEGLPASILGLAANKKTLMVVSKAVLAEYSEVLRRPRLKVDPLKLETSLAAIRSTSKLVKPTRRVKKSPDESDNRFYEMRRSRQGQLSDYRQYQGFSGKPQGYPNC